MTILKEKKPKLINDEIDNFKDDNKLSEEIEIEKERNKELRNAINKLELKYKEVIVLYFFEDKSYEEISDILHITTSNVGVMLKRAKEKLKIIINYKLRITNEKQ